jgi:hypothetical protein
MQMQPNSYRWFQVTAVVTNLLALALMLFYRGSWTHRKGMFGAVEAFLLIAVAANILAARARSSRR